MAAGVATNQLGSTDVGARLRASQTAARRAQVQSSKRSNIRRGFGGKQARNFMLGAALAGAAPNTDNLPQTPTNAYTETDQNTETVQNAEQAASTAGEAYQRTFRQNQIRNQIGESVGLLSNRDYSYNENPSELEQIQQDYAQRQYDSLIENQLGGDQRSAFAKRAAQEALKQAGLEEGIKKLQEELQKEISGFVVNMIGGTGEVVDLMPVDFAATETLVFFQNTAQVARTIVSPPPPPPEEAQDLREMVDSVKQQAQEAILNTLIPRINFFSASGLSAAVKVTAQWFFIAYVLTYLAMVIFILLGLSYAVYSFVENPLSSIIGFLRYQVGI